MNLIKHLFQCIFSLIKGIFFVIVVFSTSLFGNYIITLILPLVTIFKQHKKWRDLMDRAVTFWMFIPIFFLYYIYAVKVRVCGDSIRVDKPALVIMNHRTRLDWLYFWLALWQINPWLLTSNKIALKELLRYIPGAGFGMQASQFIFLRRDLDTDLKRLSNMISYYSAMEQPYQLLMFPEGTDKTEHTSRLSRKYGRKNGLKDFNNLLHPRTAGFVHLIKEMKKHNYISYIYDVTVAYPKTIIQNETDMIFKGRLSPNVHYDICKYSIEDIPTNTDEEISNWLISIWRQKDKKLEKYYSQKNLNRRRLEASGERNLWSSNGIRKKMVNIYAFLFWLCCTYTWFYHLQFLHFVQVGFFYLMLNYLYIYSVYGGIDNLILSHWANSKKKYVLTDISATAIV